MKVITMKNDTRDGATRIVDERQRQIGSKGYNPEHDDEHDDGGIAMAAACYAAPLRIWVEERFANSIRFVDPFPWDHDARPTPSRGNYPEPESATKEQRIRLLEKAGALCAAEIDRILRKRETLSIERVNEGSTPEQLAEGERSDAATTFYQCWRVRPSGCGPWLCLETKDFASLPDRLADIAPGETYDLEMFYATREEIDAWVVRWLVKS